MELDDPRAAMPEHAFRLDHALVDTTWYLQRYPDVAASGLEPATHYRRYGYRIGRDPRPDISSEFLRDVFALPKRREPMEALATGRYSLRPERVFPAASRLAERGRPALAARLSQRYLSGEMASVAHMFAANAMVSPDLDASSAATGVLTSPSTREAWCTRVNMWLDGHGLSPITLIDEVGRVPLTYCLVPAQPVQLVGAGPLVSVILTCRNEADAALAAGRSILNQSWANLELLVVDDASTDDTVKRFAALAATDSRMRLWRNSTAIGPSASRNIAVTQTCGSYITVHNAQDWAHPERIAHQVKFMRDGGDVACMLMPLDVDTQGRFWNPEELYDTSEKALSLRRRGIPMIQASAFHQSLGFWDSVAQGGDEELIARLRHLTDELPVLRIPLLLRHTAERPSVLDDAVDGDENPSLEAYRSAFAAYHRTLNPETARLDFPAQRRFGVPDELVTQIDRVVAAVQDHISSGMRLTRDIDVDVAIVTNLRFPGGNASSTLDELRVFRQRGLRCALIHCPVDLPVIRSTSERYRSHEDITVEWSRIRRLTARCLIVRHPRVVVSTMFQRIVKRLSAEHAFVVVNNSRLRATGSLVYNIDDFSRIVRQLPVDHLQICPISTALRTEIEDHSRASGVPLPLSGLDWTPTLNPDDYKLDVKPRMVAPISIGRHGRDGDEKWHEDAAALAQIYSDQPGVRVSILGGAEVARKRLRGLPANWTVHEFGEIEPKEYLAGLDVFVYFPRSTLVEGFGRTIGEAMMAGVPCIVSNTLERNFGPLAFYSSPAAVHTMIAAMARDDDARQAFLRDVQQVAIARFSSDAIVRRFAETGLFESVTHDAERQLLPKSLVWREMIIRTAESEAADGDAS
ncbi:glycosyltransferase [Paracoccus sp. TK19116]|uniref:Glycosyltransferase n=1 Tax=Paracoccus albicereus TaxID=2922394 RepID=A0ABT1MPB7_9RHOB|nr:glycosyltransferase [Paracoccus albicereus]MCQ0970140.1 glycosyltransferase [Paracoccus albicereus]